MFVVWTGVLTQMEGRDSHNDVVGAIENVHQEGAWAWYHSCNCSHDDYHVPAYNWLSQQKDEALVGFKTVKYWLVGLECAHLRHQSVVSSSLYCQQHCAKRLNCWNNLNS